MLTIASLLLSGTPEAYDFDPHASIRAVELKPERSRVASGSGSIGLTKSFLKKGDLDKALQAGRKALSLDPGSDELKRLLLQILEHR